MKRRRGTAIVDTDKGILVVSDGEDFILPGGGANSNESRRVAAARELYEETGLIATGVQYLFTYEGGPWKAKNGHMLRNTHKVFLVEAKGVAVPKGEIKRIGYYKDNNLNIGQGTQDIIESYIRIRKKEWIKCDYCRTEFQSDNTKSCPKCGAPKH
jgi:ADP-ribose pyrophosphatase YjhB (NUDIX family)